MAETTIPAAFGRIAPHSAAAPDAVAALIRGLDSKYFRLGAAAALGHFGTDASAAIPKLPVLQKDFDRAIHDAATKSLTELTTRFEPDPGVRSGRKDEVHDNVECGSLLPL
jgi:hypothetical protein